MPNQPLQQDLQELCELLDELSNKVERGWSSEQTLQEQWGWPFPPVNRHSLSRAASCLADEIRRQAPTQIDERLLNIIKQAKTGVNGLNQNTVQNIYGQHQAVYSYLSTLQRLREDLDPLLGWQQIRDTNLLPPKLARRLRSYQTQLDELTPNIDDLRTKIKAINEAHEAAESLPTDLESLKEARGKIKTLNDESIVAATKIKEELLPLSERRTRQIIDFEKQAGALVENCEQSYRITTTKGLSAAFAQKARTLTISMWVWVIGLAGALVAGYLLGEMRLKALTDSLNQTTPRHGELVPNIILALISLGGPIWFAWMATKQIGQRFRLAEDYAFKASVAKAYEGYRKEAARIDPKLEARLFDSALTRLEEAPLRLVEGHTPGSPWHELLESPAFSKALELVPELRDQFQKIAGAPSRLLAGNGRDSGTPSAAISGPEIHKA